MGSRQYPAAWPCGAAKPRTTVTPRGSEHSPFGRNSSAPRLSNSPRIACVFVRRANWLRSRDTANSIQAHTLGTDRRPGDEITCRVKVLWLVQPFGSRALLPHSIAHRKSFCRTANIRTRIVRAYLRSDRRHTVQLARVPPAPQAKRASTMHTEQTCFSYLTAPSRPGSRSWLGSR